MKGIIFNLLEDIVRQHHGLDVWEAMLDLSGASGIYTSLGNYSDEEIFALVAPPAKFWGSRQPTSCAGLGVTQWWNSRAACRKCSTYMFPLAPSS